MRDPAAQHCRARGRAAAQACAGARWPKSASTPGARLSCGPTSNAWPTGASAAARSWWRRIPGLKAILYYIHLEANTALAGERLPRSNRTIWLVLRQHQRIVLSPSQTRHPIERSEPLTDWQLDFKDASTVPAEVGGKQQHVIEILDSVDTGTSLLLDAQPRADFTWRLRYRPDLNAFVERYHRSYDEECLQVHRPMDLDSVSSVTQRFRQHYNQERPHQGVSCGNQPPLKTFPDLPPRPAVPAVVDARLLDMSQTPLPQV